MFYFKVEGQFGWRSAFVTNVIQQTICEGHQTIYDVYDGDDVKKCFTLKLRGQFEVERACD